MTAQQRSKLFGYWWPDACAVQGWDPEDREFRLDKFSELLGRELRSASDLNNTKDIDVLKAKLKLLSKPTLDNALASLSPEEQGRRRRLLHELSRFPRSYIEPICRSRFKLWPFEEIADNDDLADLLKTVANRFREKTNQRTEAELMRAAASAEPEPNPF